MPARNAQTTIVAAVASVQSQEPLLDEIVIAVGPSQDATQELVAKLAEVDPRIRMLDNPTGLIPHGLNLAARASSGDVIVRLDAHSIMPAGYVATALSLLRETGAANVGGLQRPMAESGFAHAVALAMGSRLGSGGAIYRSGTVAGPADTVFLGVFRREALEQVEWYDERFRRNEDAELNVRLQRAGYLVWFSPELSIGYRPRGKIRSLARQYFANGRWRRLTVKEHVGSVSPRQLLPSIVVVSLAGSLVVARLARRPLLTAPVVAYVAALFIEAAKESRDLTEASRVAVALATMHTSFGVGFLLGPPRPER